MSDLALSDDRRQAFSRQSLSKGNIRVLLLEGINESAAELMRGAGYTQVERVGTALDEAALTAALAGVHVLGIRSRTQVTRAVLEGADRLMAVGCFNVGTDQVDLEAARAVGVPVFNAPFSNTRSVAELVIGEIVMLLRRVVPRSVAAHAGGWEKSAEGSFEVRGKVLGIVGYGNIGTQLSALAEAMGMRVVYLDRTPKLRYGNTESVGSLQALLGMSDVVSLHVPDTAETAGMIGAAEIAAMKRGAYLINNSRGGVVDLEALAAALHAGHLAGAAVDVFPVEPASNRERFASPLQGAPNVILTPHIGGATEEAQARIGLEVAQKLVEYSDTGSTAGAVNFPQVQLPARRATRFMHVHRNVPGMLGRVNEVFAGRGLNILSQYLQTDAEVGYVVVDAEVHGEVGDVLLAMGALPGTIRTRLIYDPG